MDILPKAATKSTSTMEASNSVSKRRRGLGVVTPNACTECRKKRAKCDGQTPCGRCSAQKSTECVYEIPVRQSKENMRAEIEQLRAQQRLSDRILTELASSDSPNLILDRLRSGEKIDSIAEALDRSDSQSEISTGKSTTYNQPSDQRAIGSALQQVRSFASPSLSGGVSGSEEQGPSLGSLGDSTLQDESVWPQWAMGGQDVAISQAGPFQPDGLPAMMSWDPETLPDAPNPGLAHPYPLVGVWHTTSASTPDSATQQARGQGQETILGQSFGKEVYRNEPHPNYNERWTAVTSDAALVEHLMALYFCWEYPTFASLSREHFLEDFRTGRERNCSSLLVNAILSLGCRFSNQANTRTDPNNSNTAGNHFFAEAQRLLAEQADRHVLTTIQALGLMSIREASCGRSSESLFLSGQSISLAIEMGLHVLRDTDGESTHEEEVEVAVRSATFWGAFALDQAWSLSIGRLPHFSRDIKLVTKPAIIEHVEASSWIPYTDDGAPLSRSCTQPSNVRSVYKTFCELSEIVHRSLYALYTPGNNVTAKKLLTAYMEFIRWYDGIPHTLRLGHNFTPAVLFVHMYYHYAILLLFRPFIKLTILGSGVSPLDVCTQAADAISALVNSYSQLYTLRRTPSFVPYFVMTSTVAQLVGLGHSEEVGEGIVGSKEERERRVRQGIEDLKNMTICHIFANRALDIVRFLAKEWGVNIGDNGLFGTEVEEGAGDKMVDGVESESTIDYRTLCRPKSTSTNLFCPNLQSGDVLGRIGMVGGGKGKGKGCKENPLFWTFPLMGRPMLDWEGGKEGQGEGGTGGLEGAGFGVLGAGRGV